MPCVTSRLYPVPALNQAPKMTKKKLNPDKTFDGNFWRIFLPFLSLIILVLFLPYLFTTRSWWDIDFSSTGQVGDTIGGILGPFIAIGAAILTFFAFWVQFKANEQQKKDLKIERFENKFYELVRLHKANVDEINIANEILGRKAFVPMFYELRFIYQLAENFKKKASLRDQENYDYGKIRLMPFAFSIFFYGIGPNSEKHFINSLSKGEKHLFDQMKPLMEGLIQKLYLNYFTKNPSAKYYPYDAYSNTGVNLNIEFYYFPFDGHVNRLGHYYRHLYQAVRYVIDQNFIEDKYSYIKMLRAQLSNFEQLLLYYNALAWFDQEWREIFTEYRFIKNLPLPLADFDIIPEVHFKKEIAELEKRNIHMFELHE